MPPKQRRKQLLRAGVACVAVKGIGGTRHVELRATAPLYIDFARREPAYVKTWLMWSMHFAPGIQAHFHKFESQVVEALAAMFAVEAGQENDVEDRARMILASSAFLAKMVFDGVSEKRREEFVDHVLKPLTTKS